MLLPLRFTLYTGVTPPPSGGPEGGVSGYLGRYHRGGGGVDYYESPQERLSESFKLSQQIAREDEDILALLHAIMQFYD